MLLTITNTRPPATDFGYLLHKHPDRFQKFSLSFGDCHVYFPEASEERCTVALLLDVDPIEMARGKKRQSKFALAGYVNDRPFVASSFISTAISKVLGSAMNGRCESKPELVETELPLEVGIHVLPVRGGETFIRKIFEPLGYEVEVTNRMLDEQFESWGESHFYEVKLKNRILLSQLLSHLYVLIPVFDNQKHYFVGRDEYDKLLAKGASWLANHPEQEAIVRRYLKFQPSLARQAIEQLNEQSSLEDEPEKEAAANSEAVVEKKIGLHAQRLDLVCQKITESGTNSVIDLGCGEGRLIRRLMKVTAIETIVGMDVAIRSLEIASSRLRIDELPSFQLDRVKLIHGSLMYRDARFKGFDAAALVEVIEHLDEPRLAAMERVVFEFARPQYVFVTTPNSEYNQMWESLPAGKFRHPDHRFEWNREEFQAWADAICQRFGYTATIEPVGDEEAGIGAPTQIAIFKLVQQKMA